MDVLSSFQSRVVAVEEIAPQMIDGVLQSENAYDVTITKEDFAMEIEIGS